MVLGAVAVAACAPVLLGAGSGPQGASFVAGATCSRNYDYAGVQNVRPAAGIRTYLTTVKVPGVSAGHVAGWVGVGGPGLGPNRTDEWLQIGYSAFPTGETQIYYEVAQPNVAPKYHIVRAELSRTAKSLLAVREVAPGSWQALLNDKPVSPVISLPESDGKFAPQAIGETWNAGTTKCNVYGYGFGAVEIMAKRAGTWAPGKAGLRWANSQQQLSKTASGSFTARSTAAATATAAGAEPPLLGHGHLASKLIGHKVQTHCVTQSQIARELPATLLLSRQTCAVLLGYAIAQPRAPKAGTTTGLQVEETALGVLRVIAKAGGTPPAQVDCRAVELFYRAMRGLGATSREALASRRSLLRTHSQVSPPLSLSPGCPFG